MSEMNPYEPPKARVADEAPDFQPGELAGRWYRLGAAIVDSLINMIWTVPLSYSMGMFDGITSGKVPVIPLWKTAAVSLVSFLIFCAVQSYFLKNGQTIGKKLLGMRIVSLEDRVLPVGRILSLRYLPMQVVTLIPVVGRWLALVDALFIFQDSRRCVHDLIAGTKVIRV